MSRLIVWGYLSSFGAVIIVGCSPPSGPHEPLAKAAKGPSVAMSFEKILPIIRERCARCHSDGTNDWTQEENLKREASSGTLAMRLKTHSMPQEGSPESFAITDSERDLLIRWADFIQQTTKE